VLILLVVLSSFFAFVLLAEINQRIYRRRHIGNLGREADYTSRVYEQIPGSFQVTFLVDKQPNPLPPIELVESRDEPQPPT